MLRLFEHRNARIDQIMPIHLSGRFPFTPEKKMGKKVLRFRSTNFKIDYEKHFLVVVLLLRSLIDE